MSIALPRSQVLFFHMQEDLRHVKGNRVTLSKGIHQYLEDFQWLVHDLERHPPRLYNVVPLQIIMDRYHGSYSDMCWGAFLPVPTLLPLALQSKPSYVKLTSDPTEARPIDWWLTFPKDISAFMVFWGNSDVQVTNSDLLLAGRVLHHTFMVQCYDIQDRTTLAHTENTAGLWLQSKGSTASTSPPAHLICPHAMNQRFYRYIPRHNFVSGADNRISYRTSFSRKLTNVSLISIMDTTYPQRLPWRL